MASVTVLRPPSVYGCLLADGSRGVALSTEKTMTLLTVEQAWRLIGMLRNQIASAGENGG